MYKAVMEAWGGGRDRHERHNMNFTSELIWIVSLLSVQNACGRSKCQIPKVFPFIWGKQLSTWWKFDYTFHLCESIAREFDSTAIALFSSVVAHTMFPLIIRHILQDMKYGNGFTHRINWFHVFRHLEKMSLMEQVKSEVRVCANLICHSIG